jgi:iron complex outermembrane recepter protein
MTKTSRRWFQFQSGSGAATAASPSSLILGTRGITSTFTGQTAISGVRFAFAADGTLAPQVLGKDIGNTAVRQGGDGVYQDNGLKADVRSNQFYGRFDYDLTDDLHFNIFALGNFKRNTLFADFVDLLGAAIAVTNPYLTAQARALLPATATQFNVNRTILNYDYRYNPVPTTDQIYIGAALDGKIGTFDWQIYGGYGSSNLKTTVNKNINREKLAAAVDAVTVGGTIQCSTLATRPDCVPINLLGGTITRTQLDYITDTNNYRALTTLKNITAQISGPLFTLPAGEARVALSGEWREVAFKSESDHPPDLYANCTGLTRNCVATGPARTILYANTLPNLARVSQTVKEVAAEINMPLLKDAPFASDLSVNGAVRYTSYNTSGNYWSWKAGIDWKPDPAVKIRGTISRDIRAPNLFEIASAVSIKPNNFAEIVGKNVTVTNIPGYNVPNPTPTSEIGNTKTLGIVITPEGIPGFSFSVDYFDINIKNAIFTIQGVNGRVQQACQSWIASDGRLPIRSRAACRAGRRSLSAVRAPTAARGSRRSPRRTSRTTIWASSRRTDSISS